MKRNRSFINNHEGNHDLCLDSVRKLCHNRVSDTLALPGPIKLAVKSAIQNVLIQTTICWLHLNIILLRRPTKDFFAASSLVLMKTSEKEKEN